MAKAKPSGCAPKDHVERSLFHFTLHYWRPFSGLICLSAAAMLLATLLGMVVPLAAKDIIAYGKGAPPPHGPVVVRDVSAVVGAASERLYGGLASAGARVLFPGLPPDPLLRGLLCRCLLMATAAGLYQVASLAAHLSAARAGLGARTRLVEESLRRVLAGPRTGRLAAVSPARLAHVLLDCGRASAAGLEGLLTAVLPSLLAAAGTLGILVYISPLLTAGVGAGLAGVHAAYDRLARHHPAADAALAAHEALVADTLANLVERGETVLVAGCEGFVLGRLAEVLRDLAELRARLDRAVHGYAAVFAAALTLVFVGMLGALKYQNLRGDLVFMDIALYFIFLYQFVERVQVLGRECSSIRGGLGRLRTLQQTLMWFDEPVATTDGGCQVKLLKAEDEVGEEKGKVKDGNRGNPSRGLRNGAKVSELGKADHRGTMRGEADLNEQVGCAPSSSNNFISDAIPVAPSSPAMLFLHESARVDLELQKVSYTYCTAPAFLSLKTSSSASPSSSEVAGGIREVSLRVAAGCITSLYGPSGCGKSTCLRLFSGFLRPLSGVVHTQCRALLLEQHHAIFLGSVAENILLRDLHDLVGSKGAKDLRENSGGVKEEDFSEVEKRLDTALSQAGCKQFITDAFHTYIHNVNHPPFSGGQLQRICLARVFDRTESCSLVLLDEPTTGLDSDTVEELLITIKKLRDVHCKTVLISTHDERVASISDEVIRLSDPK